MPKQIWLGLFLMMHQYGFCQTSDTKQIEKLNHDWLNAYVTKDSAALDQIFADDFELISPRGDKMKKRDIIQNLKTQDITSTHIDSIDIKLLTKDVGLITAYISFEFKVDGKNMSGKNCYQDVYVKRRNRWYAFAAHVTLLQVK